MMEVIVKYRHGSEDSLDKDVVYIVDEMPSANNCYVFCQERSEDRNIAVVRGGIVAECFKGPEDELNNGILATYALHPQSHELLIERPVYRDVMLKELRVTRGVLSLLSRTEARDEVKKVLKGSWSERLGLLRKIGLEQEFNKGRYDTADVWKIIAFQLGQGMGLLEDGIEEFYTKREIAERYERLRDYLYRDAGNASGLEKFMDEYIEKLRGVRFEEAGLLISFDGYGLYDMRREKRLIGKKGFGLKEVMGKRW